MRHSQLDTEEPEKPVPKAIRLTRSGKLVHIPRPVNLRKRAWGIQ